MNIESPIALGAAAGTRLPMSACPACGGDKIIDLLRAPDRFHGRSQNYQLVKCPNCELVWLENPPTAEEMGQHYGPDYDRAIAAAGDSSPRRWKARRDTLVQYKTAGRILDLGCSSGAFLASLPSDKWELYRIEMSQEVADRAKARCGANVFVGDILDAPFTAGTFDVVTCFHVFEHIYNPKEVLTKVSYWLKPGGIFYFLVPNIDSAAAKVFKSYWYALELPRHLFHYSPASLSYLAEATGLKVLSMRTEREVFFEKSSKYVLDSGLRQVGIERLPLAKQERPRLPFRVVRKAFRLTALPVIDTVIGMAGDKESVHAIFTK
jgi:SAM-dependent methyltransferase